MYGFGFGKNNSVPSKKKHVKVCSRSHCQHKQKRLNIYSSILPEFVSAPLIVVRCCVDIYIDLVRRKDRMSFFLRVEMLNVLYIPEALRHNYMPGLLPG